MQKAYSIVILGLLISMLTACGNDEPNNESTSIMIMYNRAVNTDNNDVTFSQSNCQLYLFIIIGHSFSQWKVLSV